MNILITVFLIINIVCLGPLVFAYNKPPQNPWLAHSIYPIGHGDAAQQDSVFTAGPIDKSRTLKPNEINYVAVGPAHFGSQISSPYPNQQRVIWSIGLDRIVKIDHNSFKVLDEYYFPNQKRWTLTDELSSLAHFNNGKNNGIWALYHAFQDAKKLKSLAGIYTLLDKDNVFYVVDKYGVIKAYADTHSADPNSAIEFKRSYQLPIKENDRAVGVNMTFDGWIIVVTEHGYVIAITRMFDQYKMIRMEHAKAEKAEQKATKRTGYGWVRNGHAIDKDGGIYIASQQHMHKIIWSGKQLSTATTDGAWSALYNNTWSHGSGATPSLMGFGDEDQFVVITDGAHIMNLVLFWRNQIPVDWEPLNNGLSPRIAGSLPANMGNKTIESIQSEQSVVVAGYGALVVNNEPRNKPWYLPKTAKSLLVSYLGSNPKHQPYGIHKFYWDPQSKNLQNAWVNKKISSPNSVPIVSHNNNILYFIGARNNQWTLEAVNWNNGEEVFHFGIGDQRYNSFFAGTLLDQNGKVFYGTTWGIARLTPFASVK